MRTAAVLAIAVALAFVVWMAFKPDGDKKAQTAAPERAPATAVGAADLRALQQEVAHPVYWAGSKSGYAYELSRTAEGNVYVRYLPRGVAAGAAAADYLSVSTYPDDDAFKTVTDASKRENERVDKISGGGLAVSNPDLPGSVYVARPGSKFLVEVYDPSPARARRIATSGQVVPIN